MDDQEYFELAQRDVEKAFEGNFHLWEDELKKLKTTGDVVKFAYSRYEEFDWLHIKEEKEHPQEFNDRFYLHEVRDIFRDIMLTKWVELKTYEFMESDEACPYCGCTDPSEGDFDWLEFGGRSTTWECRKCGKHWMAYYTLTQIEMPVEETEPAPNVVELET